MSTTVTATPQAPVTAPSAPRNLQVQTPSGGGAVIDWDAPLSDGGATVTSYVLSYRASGGQWSNLTLSATSQNMAYTQLGLPYVAHEFRVAAVNSVGQSPWSTTVTATPQAPVTAPSAPRNLQVQTPSGGGAVIDWDAPLSDGGATVTSYVLSYRASGGQWSNLTVSPNVQGLLYAQLDLPYVAHEFRVAAVNSVGQSPWSTTVTATPRPPVLAPSAPRNLQVQTPSGGGAVIYWSAPASNGGGTITDYVVQYRLASSSTWITFADGVSTRLSARTTGLSVGQTYVFRVAAVSSVGQSPWSTTVTATPLVGILSSDATALTTLLQDFSILRPGVWEDGSSHSANTILRKPYSASDWEAYFSNFLRTMPLPKIYGITSAIQCSSGLAQRCRHYKKA